MNIIYQELCTSKVVGNIEVFNCYPFADQFPSSPYTVKTIGNKKV